MASATASLKSAGDEASSVRWAIVGILSVGMIIAYVSRSALSVPLALPEFIRSFHLSLTDRGMLNSAFFRTYAVLQITLWRLASASTALTHAIPQLIMAQVFLGVGQSVVAPASYWWIGTTSWRRSAVWR